MHGDIGSELRLVALYAYQVAHAIVWMDDRISNFFNAMRSTHNTFAIDRSIAIDILGTPDVGHQVVQPCTGKEYENHAILGYLPLSDESKELIILDKKKTSKNPITISTGLALQLGLIRLWSWLCF